MRSQEMSRCRNDLQSVGAIYSGSISRACLLWAANSTSFFVTESLYKRRLHPLCSLPITKT